MNKLIEYLNLTYGFFTIMYMIIICLSSFIIFMIIQLISYRIFKFNLYKWLMYNLIEKNL